MTKQTVGIYILVILLTISAPFMHILYYFKRLSHTGPTEAVFDFWVCWCL